VVVVFTGMALFELPAMAPMPEFELVQSLLE
jgi:hypothetical protein